MRILYAPYNYPQLSETYVQHEIEHAVAQGYEVLVCSEKCVRDFDTGVRVQRTRLLEAIADFRPDVLHVHYLGAAQTYLNSSAKLPLSLPITVRAHSFDWNSGLASKLVMDPRIHRIFAFPHFARELDHPKIVPMPVAILGAHFPLASDKDPGKVLRVAAGRPNKGLKDFMRVAELCPDREFTLAVAQTVEAAGGQDLVGSLRADPAVMTGRVKLRVDVPWPEVRRLTGQSGIYLDTSDPAGHRFGMPVSIAEALSTGSFVLARSSPAAEEYLAGAGALYGSVQEAAALVGVHTPTPALRRAARARGEAFHAERGALEPLLSCWRSLMRSTERRPHSPS